MKSRCSVRKMSIQEGRLYERNSMALMCCICLVVATDVFWLIVGLLNENIFPGKSSLLFGLLFVVIVLCIALGLWSEIKIRQKNFLRLRLASLFFDSLLAAEDAGVPMTNYGIAIAYMNGILERSIEIIPEV